jgi:hypothetical protein
MTDIATRLPWFRHPTTGTVKARGCRSHDRQAALAEPGAASDANGR